MNGFYSLDAERSIIAALVKGKLQKYARDLQADDFYDPDHKALFAAIQALETAGKSASIPTIAAQLSRDSGSDALIPVLMNIIQNHGFGAEFALTEHISLVKGYALRRRLYGILDDARDQLMAPENEAETVLENTRQLLRELIITGHSWESMPDVMAATFQALEDRSLGKEKTMPSGIAGLDRRTAGFHRGELTVLGARPAVGKSALGIHIALSAAANGYSVAVCSREMTDVQYGTRIIARGTRVDPQKLRTGAIDADDWAQIAEATTDYSRLPAEFMFSTRFIEDLRMEVQNKVDRGKLDLLVVDYLQLLQSKQRFEKDYQRIAYVSKMLKDMTTDLNIAIIALAQVGRSSDGSMPTLSELRGSGDIEQDADNVIFMHKPESSNDRFVHPDHRGVPEALAQNGMNYIALNVAKQRQGETGTIAVVFHPARMQFTEFTAEEEHG